MIETCVFIMFILFSDNKIGIVTVLFFSVAFSIYQMLPLHEQVSRVQQYCHLLQDSSLFSLVC